MILELFKNNFNPIIFKLKIYKTQKYFIFKFKCNLYKNILLLKNYFESFKILGCIINYKNKSSYFFIIKINKYVL